MENIPEKFLNKDGTLNSDALIKSYSELEEILDNDDAISDLKLNPSSQLQDL